MNAYLAAGQSVLEEMYGDLIKLLGELEGNAVNWTPPLKDTNTIAALVTHTMGATNSWLARASGMTIQRDRDAEFRSRASTEDLVKQVESGREEARNYFRHLADLDPATVRPVRRLSRGEDQDVTIGWCVEHAILHAGEHWGQIQLTAQLYAAMKDRT